MKFSAVPLFRAVFPVLLIVAGGCSIFPTPDNTETLYYDLDIPERCNTDLQIEVSPFTTMTSERYRMATRGEDNVIHGREFHKWVQTPGPLVTKYLRLAYRDNRIPERFPMNRLPPSRRISTISPERFLYSRRTREWRSSGSVM